MPKAVLNPRCICSCTWAAPGVGRCVCASPEEGSADTAPRWADAAGSGPRRIGPCFHKTPDGGTHAINIIKWWGVHAVYSLLTNPTLSSEIQNWHCSILFLFYLFYFYLLYNKKQKPCYVYCLKGLLHPKMKILSLITYTHVVPNP